MREKTVKSINGIGRKLYEIFAALTDRFDSSQRLNITVIALVSVTVFSLALFFNSMTHLAADDYAYNFIFLEEGAAQANGFVTGDRLSDFGDIIESMKAHYNTVNGRVLLHFFVQVMMLVGKPVFNLVNSLMLLALVFLMYLHCKGTDKRQSAVVFCMVALALWTFAPGLGVTCFWLDGSVNYLWGSVIRLSALLPFRYYFDTGSSKHPILLTAVMSVASLAAGATNENMSAVFVGLTVLYLVLYRLKGYRIPIWGIVSSVFGIAGFAFMAFAPGTGVRMDAWGGIPKLKNIAILLSNMTDKIFPFAAVAIILAIILASTSKDKKKLNFAVPVIYIVGAFAGAAVMVVSNYFPSRAWFGMIVLSLIGCGTLIYQFRFSYAAFARQCVAVAVLCWIACSVVSVANNTYEAILIDREYDKREAYIEEQKALGNFDITVRKVNATKTRSPHYGVADLSEDPNNRRNTDMAKYFGLNSIVAGENNEY